MPCGRDTYRDIGFHEGKEKTKVIYEPQGGRNLQHRGKDIKIVVLGRHNAGKTTFLEHLLGNIFKVEYNGDTISLDFGRVSVGDRILYFFGTLGQERFEVVRDVIMQGMKGAILMIDSTKGIGNFEVKLIRKLRRDCIPFVVALNKQDLSNDINLNVPELKEVNVIPVIATEGRGIKETVISLIKLLG